jgi:hypothetical protein
VEVRAGYFCPAARSAKANLSLGPILSANSRTNAAGLKLSHGLFDSIGQSPVPVKEEITGRMISHILAFFANHLF